MSVSGKAKLVKLDPQFREAVEYALELADTYGCDPIVTSGFRTEEEQARLYADLKTRGLPVASPGNSAHNYGLAVDVVSKEGYNGPKQALLRKIFLAVGFETVPRDPPHFQFPGWRRLLR